MGSIPEQIRRSRIVVAALLLLAAVVAAGFREVRAEAADPTAEAEDLESLRQEVRELRALVMELQEEIRRLTRTEAAPEAPDAPPQEPPPPPPPAPAPRPQAASLMNPAISAVFQGIGDTSLRRQRDENGFDLSEAEVALQSVVDPFAKVDLFLAFPDAESAEVEEGFVTTLALPASLQLKGGRFKSAFGRWNTLHTHAFPTIDRPDVFGLFFGEESFTNDGLSLSYLVPNPWGLYIESVTEAGTARESGAFNSAGRTLTYLQHLSLFTEPTVNSTFQMGATASIGRTGPSESLLEALDDPAVPASVTADERAASTVQGVDLTYKWRPPHRNLYHSFLWQTEVLRSHRKIQDLTPAFRLASGSVTSLGGYSYLEAQFVKRWKSGLRIDVSGLPDAERARIWAASGVVTFQPSEFQELRLQLRHSRHNEAAASLLGEEDDDTRLLLEWIPVIGAHGAHKY